MPMTNPGKYDSKGAWDGFHGEIWKEEINVRDFIQKNYKPYDGDETFLEDSTEGTRKLWNHVQKLQKEERAKGGVLECETKVVSGLTAYGPGYISEELKDLEKVVGLQTDKPLKRAFMPYGGIKMAVKAAETYGYEIDPELKKIFTEYVTTHNDAVFGAYAGTLRGMFGMKTYGINEDGTLSYLPTTESYKEALLYLNELYSANLLDKEWVVNKTEQWEQKLSGGYVFSTWNSYWDTDGVNSTLAATIGEDAQFFCYKVVADNLTPDQTTFNGRSTLGWDAIAITDNCQNVDAALRVMNYLSSEEGQYLLLWGVEGETWDMEDGVHKPHDDFYEAFTNDYDTTSNETGARKWTWFIKNGLGSDGTPYDLSTKYILNATAQFANDAFPETDNWDTADFSGLEPAGSSPLGLKWQKVTDVYDQGYSKVVNAASQDEAIAAYDAMIADMEKAGLDACEEYITEQYQARMDLWYGEQ